VKPGELSSTYYANETHKTFQLNGHPANNPKLYQHTTISDHKMVTPNHDSLLSFPGSCIAACCTTSQSMPVSNIVPVGLGRTAYNAIGIRTSKLIDYRAFLLLTAYH